MYPIKRLVPIFAVLVMLSLTASTVYFDTVSESQLDADPMDSGSSFEVDGLTYKVVSDSNEVELSMPPGGSYSGEITIPAKVTYQDQEYSVIGNAAFLDANITQITLSEGLKYISSGAFVYAKISSLHIPSTVERIGEITGLNSGTGVFSNGPTSNLSSITFAENSKLEILGDSALARTSITSLDLPESVTQIGYAAFMGCSGLSSLDLPDNGKLKIGSDAFSGTGINSLTIPAGTDLSLDRGNLGALSFATIKNIDLKFDSNDYSIDEQGVLYHDNIAYGTVYGHSTSITIPAGITGLGYRSFTADDITSITLPSSVTQLGSQTFLYSNIIEVIAPGVTSFDAKAFQYCNGLTKLTLAKGCDVPNGAFRNTSLQYVTLGDSYYSITNGSLGSEMTWYAEGNSSGNYTIDTAEELLQFSALVNSGIDFYGETVNLGDSIDLDDLKTEGSNHYEWTPIGVGARSSDTITGNVFRGTFDGQDNTISNMNITTYSSEGVGLFAFLDGGVIQNLILSGVNITTTQESTGAVVGAMSDGASIVNVHVSGSVKGNQGVGGIVGRILSEGSVSGCTNAASVEGATVGTASGYNVGGIVGAAYYHKNGDGMLIKGCVNTGDVVSATSGAGGIVGLSLADVIECKNSGKVTGNGASIGGIIGEQRNGGIIDNCDNSGEVTNNSTSAGIYGTGGIVGWIRNLPDGGYSQNEYSLVSLIDCDNIGAVSGGNYGIGGVAGVVYHAVLMDRCSSDAVVTGGQQVGGLIGNFQNTETSTHVHGGCSVVLTDNTVSGNISGSGNVNALIGHPVLEGSGCDPGTSPYSHITAYGNTNNTTLAYGVTETPVILTIGETEYGYSTIGEALNDIPVDTQGAVIRLEANITVTDTVTVDVPGVVIDLNGKTITGGTGFTGTNPHLMSIEAEGVTLRNGTLVSGSNNTNVLNVYDSSGVVLEDLVLDHSQTSNGYYPVVVNGSQVTFAGTVTFKQYSQTSAGINVDNGSDSQDGCSLAFADGATLNFLTSSAGIYVETEDAVSIDYNDVIYTYDADQFRLLVTTSSGDNVDDGQTQPVDGVTDYTVTFQVSPSDVMITITKDGESLSRTGSGTVSLKAGTYSVVYSADGYVSEQDSITVLSNMTVDPVSLERQTGSLHIDVTPENATVTIDGNSYENGDTITLAVGTYTVTVSAEGYVTQYPIVTISADQTTTLDTALVEETVPETGTLTVSVFPSRAIVSVGGQSAVGGGDFVLEPGTYLVTAHLDGYESYSDYVTIAAGETSHLSIRLSEEVVYPPFNPGYDDDDTPLPPSIVVEQSDSGDDDTVKVAACAAAAVAAAIIAMILVAEYRKR